MERALRQALQANLPHRPESLKPCNVQRATYNGPREVTCNVFYIDVAPLHPPPVARRYTPVARPLHVRCTLLGGGPTGNSPRRPPRSRTRLPPSPCIGASTSRRSGRSATVWTISNEHAPHPQEYGLAKIHCQRTTSRIRDCGEIWSLVSLLDQDGGGGQNSRRVAAIGPRWRVAIRQGAVRRLA